MKTFLAIVGGIFLFYLFARFIFPIIVGYAMPISSGKVLLEKYLKKYYGYPSKYFPDDFLYECVEEDYKIAQYIKLYGNEKISFFKIFEKFLMITAGDIADLHCGKNVYRENAEILKNRMLRYEII